MIIDKTGKIIFFNKNKTFLYMGTEKKQYNTLVIIENEKINKPIKMPPLTKSILEKKHSVENADLKDLPEKIQCIIAVIFQIENICDQYKVDRRTHYYFSAIIGKWKKKSRQRALTKLVEMRKTNLLSLIAGIRDEITCAIFRECARQRFFPTLLIETAKTINGSDIVRKYAKLFLAAINQYKMADMVNSADLFYISSHNEKMNILSQYIEHKKIPMFYVYLSENYTEEFYDHIHKLVYTTSNKYKRGFLPFSKTISILISLIKYVEMLGFPNLLVGIIYIITSGRSVEILFDENLNIKKQTIELKSNYLIRRINSLLLVWKKNDYELFTRFIIAYLTNIPPETEKFVGKKTPLMNIDLYSWINQNLIFSQFENDIKQIISNHKTLLSKIMIHLSKKRNVLYHTWIVRNFDAKSIRQQITRMTFPNRLLLYLQAYVYPKHFNFFSTLRVGKKNIIYDKIKWHSIKSINEEGVNRLIHFFNRLKIKLPINYFKTIIDAIGDGKYNNLDGLIKYLGNSINNKNEFDNYFEVVVNKVSSVFNIDRYRNNCLKLLGLLLKWKEYTGYEHPTNYYFDALLFLFQDDLPVEKIESYHSISVNLLVNIYYLLNGRIHPRIEASIQFALSKPNWDQMARHYLAMGIAKPKRKEIMKSQLRKIPKELRSDILGKIALVTQSFEFGYEFGFNKGIESVIIDNIYFRGWNIDRKIQNKIDRVFGNVSPRLRSYIAAYMILDRSEINNILLSYACNIDDHQIRMRLLRSLERFGSPSMWVTLANSIYMDISTPAVEQISKLRLNKEDRFKLCKLMINSRSKKLRNLGVEILTTYDFTGIELQFVKSFYPDTWGGIIKYCIKYKGNFDLDLIFLKYIFMSGKLNRKVGELLVKLIKETKINLNLDYIVDSIFNTRREYAVEIAIKRGEL